MRHVGNVSPRDRSAPDPYAPALPPSASITVVKDSRGTPDGYLTAIAKQKADAKETK
jgi:hypothetical protein